MELELGEAIHKHSSVSIIEGVTTKLQAAETNSAKSGVDENGGTLQDC